jgi:hypothetical protein
LVADEFIEIGVGEHAARARLAVAERDVAQRAGGDVLVESFDRDAELRCGLGAGAQAVWRADASGRAFSARRRRPIIGRRKALN